jgi:hypothetical protein
MCKNYNRILISEIIINAAIIRLSTFNLSPWYQAIYWGLMINATYKKTLGSEG